MRFVFLVLFFICLSTGREFQPSLETQTVSPEILAASDPLRCAEYVERLKRDPTVYFGWINSSENFESPEQGADLKIFFYGRKGTMNNPILFFNGGPGSDSHGSMSGFEKFIRSFSMDTQKFNFIFMDQRGTGCSSKYPNFSKLGPNEMFRVRFYGARGIVHDAEILRHHLIGNRKWKIYGQSFGASIVHQYVTSFPDSIERAYAHGNAITTSRGLRKVNEIYAQHRVLNSYLKKYPTDRARINVLSNFLSDKEFCINWYCGNQILNFIVLKNLSFPALWNQIHANLEKIVNYNNRISSNAPRINFEELRKQIESSNESIDFNNNHFVTGLILDIDSSTAAFGKYDCKETIRGVEKLYRVKSEDLGLTKCTALIQHEARGNWTDAFVSYYKLDSGKLSLQEFKNGLSRLNQFQDRESSNPGNPRFYLYSSEHDAIVPKESFKDEVNVVGKMVRYMNFKNSGHDGAASERQIYEDLLK